MINRMKKHLWPVPLVAALAVVGVMAAFIALSAAPGTAQAQEGFCDTLTGGALQALIDIGLCPADDTQPEESNKAPVVSGSLDDVSLRISMTHGPMDVSAVFEDADDGHADLQRGVRQRQRC